VTVTAHRATPVLLAGSGLSRSRSSPGSVGGRRLAEVRIEGFGAPIRLTCSIGVAASDTLQVWGQHLIAHADTAQYAAKRSGRNCVELATALAVT
jgi:GGDEF domain-containing protein